MLTRCPQRVDHQLVNAKLRQILTDYRNFSPLERLPEFQQNGCDTVFLITPFDSHISKTVARAFTRANLIHKCFTSRDAATLWRALVVYVRPLLEYATCVSSPYCLSQIKHVESVQRQFTKRLPGYGSLDYRSRLTRLHADSLELRRLRHDLIYTYKVIFGLVNGAGDDLFTLTSLTYSNSTRGHAYKLFPHYNRVDLHKYFFSLRV